MFIYIGVSIGGLIGAYIPVVLFRVNPLGLMSIVGGVIGSFAGLLVGYKVYQNSEY